MSGKTPEWKIFQFEEYRASTRTAAEAAWMVSFYKEGGAIKFGHTGVILWFEGKELFKGDYDTKRAAEIMEKRLLRYRAECVERDRKRLEKAKGKLAISQNRESAL